MWDVIRIAFVLELCLLILAITTSEGAKTKLKNIKKLSKEVKEIKEVDICDLQKLEAPFFCYCNGVGVKNVTDTNCLIFDKFEEVNPLWNHFESQIFTEKLTFKVRLPNGNLTYIPTQVLKQLKHVHILIIEYAKIHKLQENVFSNYTAMNEISLMRNSITSLAEYAFNNMKNLIFINLDENQITEIRRLSFVNLPSLKKLMINKNNITTIYAQAFSYLNTLQELELNGNQISVITRDMFNGLRSLQKLDLRNNLVHMIGEESFMEMPELQELQLDQNMIEYISQKALAGMRNLKVLKLSENKLAALDPDFLSQAPGVNFLDLRDNLLKTMTFDNVKPIVTNLYNNISYFYLNGNKLICDCKLQWIWGLRNETRNIKLRENLEELTCFLESKNASVKSVKDAERNSALAIARNPDEYMFDNLKEGNRGTNDYLDDATNYDDSYEDEEKEVQKSPTKMEIIDGKVGYMKELFQLKPEDLPCPEPSREDLMASEQPSSRHANAAVGSAGIFFFSSGKIHYVSQSVLALSFLVASRFFT
ncbi:connectin-like isoform X2 [Leptopilina boulardi]|nr:connectin-like isoform X2 [Leptopilina boulardi]XP_051160092.1 connectin-like isoform X2 [Leptopilina boulardi]XP_051160093.1 connectin-like isoform X2 [Leptopilina boulardi]